MGRRFTIIALVALAALSGAYFALGGNFHLGKTGSDAQGESGTAVPAVSVGQAGNAKGHGRDGRATSDSSSGADKRDGDRHPDSDSSGFRADNQKPPRDSSGSPDIAPREGATDKPPKDDGAPAESAGKPTHSKEPRSQIIDAERPRNQTLGNVKPRARALGKGPAKKLEDVSDKHKQDRRGLYAQYFAFASEPLAELAKPEAKPLAQREASQLRIDDQVHFPNNEAFADLPFDQRNFAASWDGYLVIPEQGEYWLFLGADNAARLDLNGETVLLNDVQSRYIEVSTVLTLEPGLHELRIEYAQGMLANEDSWRCACSFMYVPKSQQKPVAVPKEMLMLPQWMWHDNAPIITKLDKYDGEIGDEIVIQGQALCQGDFKGSFGGKEPNDGEHPPEVYFNGQRATLLTMKREELKVRIPIGASTGKLLLIRSLYTKPSGVMPKLYRIPSNSVDFKVTTQFGLLAQWYDLKGSPNRDFVEPGSCAPDLVRVERKLEVFGRENLDLPFKREPFACRWEGFVGIPKLTKEHVFRVGSTGSLRVTLGNLKGEAKASSFSPHCAVDLTVKAGDELKLPLLLEWVNDTDDAVFMTFLIASTDAVVSEKLHTALGAQWFFPPVTPPKPPKIAAVIPLAIMGDEQPPAPPFAAPSGLISIREGQQFKCNVEIFGDEEVKAAPVSLFVDSHALECGSGALVEDDANKRTFRQFVCVLPPGCGEGRLTAKLGLSTSEPFFIDVANKGLIAYLYDLPNPSGYAEFPNVHGLVCHTIRKDRDVNFDTADAFALPFVAETFAMEWYGAIIIEKEGHYTFTTLSDDGVRVWLNGSEIIDDDNLHAPREKSSAKIRLSPGTYTFRMQFFECNQHEKCVLHWQATDLLEAELIAKQVVPKRAFTWEKHDMLPDKFATGKKADGSE